MIIQRQLQVYFIQQQVFCRVQPSGRRRKAQQKAPLQLLGLTLVTTRILFYFSIGSTLQSQTLTVVTKLTPLVVVFTTSDARARVRDVTHRAFFLLQSIPTIYAYCVLLIRTTTKVVCILCMLLARVCIVLHMHTTKWYAYSITTLASSSIHSNRVRKYSGNTQYASLKCQLTMHSMDT